MDGLEGTYIHVITTSRTSRLNQAMILTLMVSPLVTRLDRYHFKWVFGDDGTR